MSSLSKIESTISLHQHLSAQIAAQEAATDLPPSRDAQAMTGGGSALPAEPEWIGPFTAEDRRAINTLRRAQASAIVAGDAVAYAQLCADDIQLLIPGHDIVSGHDDFLAAQATVFRTGRFTAFHKQAERIELSGDLAIEVGRQDVQMTSEAAATGIFSPRQKYLHVFRRTPLGWRFSVLMSNPRA